MVFPALGAKTRPLLEDEGAIFVFNVNNERQFTVLRGQAGPGLALAVGNPYGFVRSMSHLGHAGTVRALTFLPAHERKHPLLVSAAREPIGTSDNFTGSVRLWDVSTGTSLADSIIATKEPGRAPALTAWHTGNDPKDVGVAIAWWDGQVRVWDVAHGKLQMAPDGRNNSTVASVATAGQFPTSGQFLTASMQTSDCLIHSWLSEAEKPPSLQTKPRIQLTADDPKIGPYYLPIDLATFPSQANGSIDRAVLLARRQGPTRSADDQDVLFLLDLTENKVLARHTLGTFQVNMRRLAVSPTGKHIAVADADNQRVLVFSISNFGEAARPQVLRGHGTNFTSVSFGKKGNDPGLLLTDGEGAKMVFDFHNRRLVADDDTWKKDTPDTSLWQIDPKKEGDQVFLTVSGPDFKVKSILLGKDCKITAGAFLPPRKGLPFGPLLAVGWLDEFSQPMLALYDVASGTQVRQFAGHTTAVHSLSFASDGRFLASVAADQTVRLWSMTSLDQVLDKAGALSGVVVVQQKTHLEVARVPEGSSLKKGAVIEGLVEKNEVRELATPLDFYTTLFDTKPKTDIVLSVRQPGTDKATNLAFKVGQGTDQRNPLLSLFVTRAGELAKRDWIAWTSMGPYDASGLNAEKYLGWHFNPEKAADPIDFARADKYRDKYEAKGILTDLLRLANATKAFEEWKTKPLPEMEVSIDEIGPEGPRVGDRRLTRTRVLTPRMTLPTSFPRERLNAVSWQLDGGPWQPFSTGVEGPWSLDLASLPWDRGSHVIGVRLEIDALTRRFDKTVAFHYLPEAPRIEFSKEWLEKNFPDAAKTGMVLTTKKDTFVLEAEIHPGTSGEELKVTVQQGNDKPVTVKGPRVHHEFKLKEGANYLKIQAVNAKALEDLKQLEMAEQEVRVDYYRERAAPQIAFSEVVPLVEGGVPIRVQPGELITVSVPKVRIVGKVVGEENLQEVKRDKQSLANFDAGKMKQFDFKDEITLKKGEQVLLYTAKSKNSPPGEGTLRLVYQPPVGQIRSVRPVDKSILYDKEIELNVALISPDHMEPYTATVLVNGNQQPKVELEAGRSEFKSKIKLDPGSNRIVVRLDNDWKAEAVRELQVTYRRPPRIVEFRVPKEVDKAVQNFDAVVESPPELPPCEVHVNEARFRDDRLQVELLDRERGRWKVTLREVELKEGDNILTLVVANTDGDSPMSAPEKVRFTKPKPPVPIVRFRDFKDEEVTYELPRPKQLLRFSVTSATLLTQVELRGENDTVLFKQKTEELKEWKANQPLQFTVEIRLSPARPTTFHLVATNEGGHGQANATLQIPERPAYVVIDKLESLKPGGKEWSPSLQNDSNGLAVFDVIPEGRVKLSGHIYWNDPDDKRFQRKINLRVFCNDFQQLPAEADLPKPKATETTFTATVLLTRAQENVVEVDLPDFKRAEGQRHTCVVRKCTDLVLPGRRLHLVIIGIDVKDGAALKKRALDAVSAKQLPGAEGGWQALPFFEKVVVYEPLVGGVSQGQILKHLDWVKRQIQASAPEDRNIVLSEVVLVYYQGREMLTPEGHFLLSDDYKGYKDLKATGVNCVEIVEKFSDARGVQVMMFDVARVQADAEAPPVTRAFEGTRVGFFHSFWSGEKPPVTRLLPMLQQSWSKANNLDSLAKQIGELCRDQAPQMRFLPYLPGQLAQLEFGGKR